jgi:hypothetical protein
VARVPRNVECCVLLRLMERLPRCCMALHSWSDRSCCGNTIASSAAGHMAAGGGKVQGPKFPGSGESCASHANLVVVGGGMRYRSACSLHTECGPSEGFWIPPTLSVSVPKPACRLTGLEVHVAYVQHMARFCACP